jgi:hypothetical protein
MPIHLKGNFAQTSQTELKDERKLHLLPVPLLLPLLGRREGENKANAATRMGNDLHFSLGEN